MKLFWRWLGMICAIGIFFWPELLRISPRVEAANLSTVSVELSTARFAVPSDLTIRFTTATAIPDGSFRIFVPAAAENSSDGQADVGGWDFGSGVTVTCPDDVNFDGHFYDFGAGQTAAASVLRAGQMYHVFECPYSGPGRDGSVFNSTIFGAIKLSSLLNPVPRADHQPGLADTYSILIEHVSSGGERVDATFAEVAIVEAVNVSGVVVTAIVPERPTPIPSPSPTPLPAPPVVPLLSQLLVVIPWALLLLGLLGYVIFLFFLTGNAFGFFMAFLFSLLNFWLLPWLGKRHELREQEGKRSLPWTGFSLTWLDEQKHTRERKVMTNISGQWDTSLKTGVMHQVVFQSRSFVYPADKVATSEHRPQKGDRELYVVGESFWLFESKSPQATTAEYFAIPADLAFRFVVWVKRGRPGPARWRLFVPRFFLLLALAASFALVLSSPQWWSVLLAVFVLYIFLRDLLARVPHRLEVYTA